MGASAKVESKGRGWHCLRSKDWEGVSESRPGRKNLWKRKWLCKSKEVRKGQARGLKRLECGFGQGGLWLNKGMEMSRSDPKSSWKAHNKLQVGAPQTIPKTLFLACLYSRACFFNFSTTDILNQLILRCGGLSWALQNVSPPARYQ